MGKSKKTPVKTKTKESNGRGLSDSQSSFSTYGIFRLCVIVMFAVLCGILNSYHEYSMFENDRHFSHLSSLEREMTFRTEMGLYFSFYKTIVEAPTLMNGVDQLLHCNLTEYPKTINAVRKYNLFPEIILGSSFRLLRNLANNLKIKIKECWVVDRGVDLDDVESCEGIGDLHYFYVAGVFSWNSFVAILIFFYGLHLSDSFLGGLLAVSAFFYNHGEATRVQWTPPLRESFGYPFCLSGLLFVSCSLKYPAYSIYWKILIALSSIGFITTWQFAQFPLLIQTLACFSLYILGFVNISQLKTILQAQIIGLACGFLLLFANPLILASFYAPFLLIAFVLCYSDGYFPKDSKLYKFTQLFLAIGGTLLLKFSLNFVFNFKDDNHIWNLLRSKFSSYKDFHTLLYTCAAEFDFLDKESLLNITKTFLLPISIILICVVVFKIVREIWTKTLSHSEYGAVVFLILQTWAFAVMAVLFMRLKLLLTPNLCILTSLIASKKLFPLFSKTIWRVSTVILIISLMSVNGIKNLKSQREILGEYSNLELEQLLLWVNKSTVTNAVFSGPMPTMANLMLSTRRPIVNNPFYEDSTMRETTLKVYSLYSRKEPQLVHQILKDLGVNFAVIVRPYCHAKNKAGCAMIDLWDVEDPSNSENLQLCQRLMTDPHPFTFVFRNDEYAVLKI